MPSTIRAGETVLLLGPDGERHVVRSANAPARVAGLGVVDSASFVGRNWGDAVTLGLREYVLTRPVLADHLRRAERKAQIILPKDAARILLETGLGAGDRVVEAGVGSGALTVVLAHAVAPNGRVHAYDLREDHLAVGRRNLEAAGLAHVVELKVGDVRQGVGERDVDAFVLDVPDPEAAIDAAQNALRPGGVLAVYVPLVGQLEKAVAAARAHGFLDVRALELLERAWVVHDRGSRPDFDMLGHTGFLLFARRR